MTTATVTSGRPAARRSDATLGVVLLVAGVALVALESPFRRGEAAASAFLLGVTHLASHAQSVGTAVIFPNGHQWIGVDLTPGCTSALLVAPFIFLTGGMLLARRVRPLRALLTLGVVILIVLATNQARLAAISGAMRLWGLQTGYDRGHVLLGTLVSTFGVAVGVVVFLVALSRPDRATRSRRRSAGAPGAER